MEAGSTSVCRAYVPCLSLTSCSVRYTRRTYTYHHLHHLRREKRVKRRVIRVSSPIAHFVLSCSTNVPAFQHPSSPTQACSFCQHPWIQHTLLLPRFQTANPLIPSLYVRLASPRTNCGGFHPVSVILSRVCYDD